MFDWLHVLARRLGHFIVHVPIYVAGPSMILIGALDSSLLSMPEVNDYLVVARCYTHPRAVLFFPMFPAIRKFLAARKTDCTGLITTGCAGAGLCAADTIDVH
jgi:hypothetical protein